MKKRVLTFLTAMVISVCAIAGNASAAEAPQAVSPFAIISTSQQEIMPFADEILVYYAVNENDGKLYKRRWNATRGYWVDPYWILVG